jgi:hypothetical protein
MSSYRRRFGRSDRDTARRFGRGSGSNGSGGANGSGGSHANGGAAAIATRAHPTVAVAEAIEGLDPAARALLDLSLRWDMDDEQMARVSQTDVETLHASRAEAVRLVTAGIDVPPEEELEYVRRGLAVLYKDTEVAPAPAELPDEDRTVDTDLDELESLLDLPPAHPLDVDRPEPAVEPQPEPVAAPEEPTTDPGRRWGTYLLFGILALAAFLRLWQINRLGLNSDEAVYAGQGAAIANDATLEPYFPAFRAHPLLFQTFLSLGAHLDILEIFGRVLSAAVGVATVGITYLLGKLLYGRRAGLVAALFMALMPYHVVVTRQILLDGPMVMFATLSLYLVARYAVTQRPAWLYAAGAAMGLTAMSKETSLVLLGSIYAFLALTPHLKVTVRRLLGSIGVMGSVLILFPLSLQLAGKAETGGNYLAWQLFRRPNHDWIFYASEVPKAIGFGVVIGALVGLWTLRKRGSWRETLLLAWIAVPVVFFQLWPVKGFQYLLPIAPAVAILAARTMARWGDGRPSGVRTFFTDRRVAVVATGVICATLLLSTWGRIDTAGSATFLAGSGGVPGGREAGGWIEKHVPKGARMLAVGPSMANILQFYGHRKAYGLSVSPNPLNRNPSYEPIKNPDQAIRANDLQYLIWDAYSASRSKFFSRSLQRYADRYHGRLVHTEFVRVNSAKGHSVLKPVIKIFEVRP